MNKPALKLDDNETLDYEELYRNYSSGLIDKLRGFGVEAEYLALWVADEDVELSIRNLFDAAAQAQESRVRLKFRSASYGKAWQERLLSLAKQFGGAKLEHGNDVWFLEVRDLRETKATTGVAKVAVTSTQTANVTSLSLAMPEAWPDSLPAHYTKQLAGVPDLKSFSVAEGTNGAFKVSSAKLANSMLELVVEKNGLVGGCGFSVEGPNYAARLVNALARSIIGLPLQEVADHSVMALEYGLRGEAAKVEGIALVRTMHPAFALLEELVRTAVSAAKTTLGITETTNEYDRPLGEKWRKFTRDERVDAVLTACKSLCEQSGGTPNLMSIDAIQFDLRIVISADWKMSANDRAKFAYECERVIRENVDPRLEVYLAELRDKNKLRRLAVVEGN